MDTIVFVNHNVINCGVYQYGKRVFDICQKSKIYDFQYIESTCSEDLFTFVQDKKPSIIFYNYLPDTMPWFNDSIFQEIKSLGVKQGNIVHNCQYGNFDFYLHQDPYYKNNENNFALLRPLFEYVPKNDLERSDTIQIGTFGFGGQHKFVPEICRLVAEEFTTEPITLNLHVTEGFYSGNIFEEVKNECIDTLRNQNINLNITNNFLTTEDLLNFLYQNDLNIFFYENYSFYNGISSSIDYALSVKKPIAICKSNMFSHIMDVTPSICVEDTDLVDIINNGFLPLQEKYNSWTHKKFIDNIEMIVEKLL